MTAPDPLREDEVREVAKALSPLGWHEQNGRMLDWPAYVAMREKSLVRARAAILRLDEIREGRK